jgi:hypothetical protein
MRPPSNIIMLNKYTIGDEFVLASSKVNYQGYYYEFQGKFFIGKTFDAFSPEIVKKESVNSNQSGSFTSLPLNNLTGPINLAFDQQENESSFRYFTKQVNTNPILIKEISIETFKDLQSNPLYQTLAIPIEVIEDPVTLERLNKIMLGIKDFLMS